MGNKKGSKSKIGKAIDGLLESDFFKSGRTPSEVVKKLASKGFTLKGKQVSMIARMLTLECQNPEARIEREEIPLEKRVGQEKWLFKKIK